MQHTNFYRIYIERCRTASKSGYNDCPLTYGGCLSKNECISNPGEADRQLKMADEIQDYIDYLDKYNDYIRDIAIVEGVVGCILMLIPSPLTWSAGAYLTGSSIGEGFANRQIDENIIQKWRDERDKLLSYTEENLKGCS